MASPRTLSGLVVHLSDDDIMAMVGPATWGKGLTCFRSGLVLEVRAEGDLRAVGRVRGPGVTFRTWIEAVEGRLDLTCACTVGRDCRHCVATLLQLRDDLRRATPREGEWRNALSGLVGESGIGGESMALFVDTHDPSSPLWMSPLRPGTHTRWVTKRASWLDITNPQWASVTEELNPTHLALLREGYRYSREGPQWRSPNEVSLESLGERAGPWLRRLDRAGIALFADTDPLVPLVLDPRPWTLAVDARRTQAGLSVGVAVTDGTTTRTSPRIDVATRLLLLDGGTRIGEIRGGEDLLENLPTGGLTVPEGDLAEFQTRWLPRLERTVAVVSTDGTYSPEEVSRPLIVATVRLEDSSALVVRWWVEYTIGGATSRLPLEQADADAGAQDLRRDIEARAARLHLPEELWRRTLRTLRLPAWRAPEFLDRVVGDLETDGLVWDVAEEVSDVRVDADAMLIDTSIGSEGSTDWFDLRARVLVNGREVELRDLLAALASGEDHMLVDGVWVTLDGERLEHLRSLLADAETLGDTEGETIRLSVLQAGLWEELEDVSDHVEASREWTKRVRALTGHGDLAGLPVPPSSTVELRPYQEQGHRWLTALATLGLGGILADDMGLGKTIQVLSAVRALRDAEGAGGSGGAPVLVVAPTSVLGTWAGEARRFFPDLVVQVVDATSRRRGGSLADLAADADVLVTSYTIVRMEPVEWADIHLSGLVVDEAQAIKNPRTAIHSALMGLDAGWRVAVTGTPVENSVADLWSILQVTDPGLLPGWKTFNDKMRRPIETHGDEAALERLRRLTAPFVLRRTKEQVAPELPDKTESVVEVALGEEHRRIYDQFLTRERSRLLGLLDDLQANRMVVLSSITRLRQLALDPALVDPAYSSVGSAKVEFLADQLDQVVPAGHQVLVFSQFTSFLARIRGVLERRGMEIAYLDGATRDREGAIEEFRSGRARVFLISLKAGGTGLTLTEADYVYVMDPWWNPAAEAQAVDRAHRIGQSKKVNVYRLVAEDTIEQKVLDLQDRKRQLVSAVVDGGGAGSGRITADDLRALLES